jgi:hypothetical protein
MCIIHHCVLYITKYGILCVNPVCWFNTRWFEPWAGQIKDYQIRICCFSIKHAALRRKSKGWLSQIQDNVSAQGDMSTRGLLFQ